MYENEMVRMNVTSHQGTRIATNQRIRKIKPFQESISCPLAKAT